MRKFLLVVIAVFVVCSLGRSDDKSLSAYLSKAGATYGQAYLAPLSNSFGADINSGWFHGANPGSNGFHIYLGVKAFAATIPDADKLIPAGLSYTDSVIDGNIRTQATFTVDPASPTVFGDENTNGVAYATVNGHPYTQTVAPGLVSTSIAPLAMPQLTIGTIMGTDFTIRYLPTISIGNYGSIGFWGFGVRHSISQYLGGENAPVDIAVQVAFQGLTIKDSTDFEIVKNSAWLANVEVSKSFSLLTLYGGLQTEKSSMDIAYNYHNTSTNTDIPIAFTLDAKNTFRAIIGVNLGLGPLILNADYNMGSINTISGGFGLSF